VEGAAAARRGLRSARSALDLGGRGPDLHFPQGRPPIRELSSCGNCAHPQYHPVTFTANFRTLGSPCQGESGPIAETLRLRSARGTIL